MRRKYKAYLSKRAFWKRLYAVRQIVAFYHLDRAKWLHTSIQYLNQKEFVEFAGEAEETRIWTKDDPEEEIFEAIIDSLGRSMEYACGYHGSWDHVEDESDDYDYGRVYYGRLRWKEGYFR